MRLTLRTLLAYLDDALPPAETKDIGERVSKSPIAAGFVSRIKAVLKKRRIEAPAVTGDPQAEQVAAYLDNELPQDELTNFEAEALNSDELLAEVAASHQILTLVMGEPISISPALRTRLYGLGGMDAAPPTKAPGVAQVSRSAPRRSTDDSLVGVSAVMDGPSAIAARRRTKWPWIAGAAGLGVIWLGLVSSFLGGRDEPAAEQALAANQEVAGEEVGGDPAAGAGNAVLGEAVAEGDPGTKAGMGETADANTSPTNESPAGAEIAIAAPEVTAGNGAAGNGAKTMSSPAVPDSDSPAATAEPSETSEGTALAAANAKQKLAPEAAPTEMPSKGEPSTAVEEPAAPAMKPFGFEYVSVEGVVLQRAADEDSGDSLWATLPRRSVLFPEETLVVPEPFRARLTVNKADGEVVLVGGFRGGILPPTDTHAGGIRIDRGRLIIRTGEKEKPLRFAIAHGGKSAVVDFPAGEHVAAVTILPEPPAGRLDGEAVGAMSRASLFAITGEVTIESGETKRVVSVDDGAVGPFGGVAPAFEEYPEWATEGDRPRSLAVRRSAEMFEKMVPADARAEETLPAILRDRRPQISALAAKAVALMELPLPLVRGLNNVHEETRIASFEGLQDWLVSAPERKAELRGLTETVFRDDLAEAAEKLVLGYSPDDLHDPSTSEQLLDWMRSTDIGIRQMAFHHVARLTGRRFDYRPNGLESQRNSSLKRWSEYVRREGGVLIGPPIEAEPESPQDDAAEADQN